MSPRLARFCESCGGALSYRTGARGNARAHCPVCIRQYVDSPKIVVGCLVSCDERVLLCRRSIAPCAGSWNAPAGFAELNEGLEEAALRETWEEAGIVPESLTLYSVTNLLDVGQLHFMFRAVSAHMNVRAGGESSDCAFFGASDLPWEELWYPQTSHEYLRRYLGELRAGRFACYLRDISGHQLERETVITAPDCISR